jgi:hypothetical protein
VYRWILIALLAAPATSYAQPVEEEEQPETAVPDQPVDDEVAPGGGEGPPEEAGGPPAPIVEEPAPPPESDLPMGEADAEEEEAGETTGQNSFFDIRLNLTLTNENVFAEPGETIPSVPGWRFGVPNSIGTLFFDNYDTRFSGYETLSHAVLYKRHAKQNWEVEGAMVIRINDIAERSINLSDAGSYIRVAYWLDPERKKLDRFSVTAFPTSSDRMRLGYSYRLSWGGSDEYRRSGNAVPGIKLQYDWSGGYVFLGAKSAVLLDTSTAEEEAVLAFLAGAGFDITDMFRVEANTGCFDRGNNVLQDVIDEKVILCGVSAQAAIHKGEAIGSSIDYKLYRNDPERIERLFRQASYQGGLTWLVKAEATMLTQTLKDPAVSGGTVSQQGIAGDINARVKINRTRLRFDAQVRDLAFILHSTPSLPTYTDFPDVYDFTPNFFIAAGVDQNFEDTGLTLGLVVGLDMPATLTTPTGMIPGDPLAGGGESTAVVRREGDLTILPEGEDALPQFAAKLTARLDFNEFFATLLDVYYSRDPNQARLTRDGPGDLLRREFSEFNQLGFNLALQAKF